MKGLLIMNKKFLLFLVLIFSLISSVSQATTVPPWWMIQQSLASSSDKTIGELSISSATIPNLRAHFKVGRSSSVGIASSTISPLVFNSVATDTASGYNASSGVYTVPVSGWWLIDCRVTWENKSPGGAECWTRIMIGSTPIDWGINCTALTTYSTNSCSFFGYLTAGQQIAINVEQSTGSTLNIVGDSYLSFTRFSGARLF